MGYSLYINGTDPMDIDPTFVRRFSITDTSQQVLETDVIPQLTYYISFDNSSDGAIVTDADSYDDVATFYYEIWLLEE